MALTLDEFAARCHAILARDATPAGREQVAGLLREALRDEAFVASQFGPDAPERRVVYQDPQLGFCILAHAYPDARESPPHDHADTWAIYGQAQGETSMSDWEVLEAATPEQPGRVRKTRDYVLRPGDAHVYNEGEVHSPGRAGPTRLIRLEGRDLAGVRRVKYRAG
jgi:predicted metal-dependent enzyme (double-stranded beta helix superfamily)